MHDIRVNHVTRVEGHGNIVVNTREGRVEEVRLEIVESPRFFEVMLKGRRCDEASHITSRICGICAIGHTTASLKATESALGLVPSEQTVLLRKILLNAEIIQSHVLHYYFLVAPDFFGVGSVIPMADTHPDIIKRALRLKKMANDVCETLVGRHIHPIGMTINGFTRLPAARELDEVRRLLESAIPDMEETVRLFKGLKMPDFTRKTGYFSLTEGNGYALYDGRLVSTEGTSIEVDRYKEVITEHVVEHSTAKHVSSDHATIMVGALARMNNNFSGLCSEAKSAADTLGLNVPCHNPFMNN
ncbi:MAG: Ni/Fe hydrogenase subunit alpha, partial [Thermodesulfobacteriota bacterium]